MGAKTCRACGAGLEDRSARCPLCGAEAGAKKPKAASRPRDSDDYQAQVRRLRTQLAKLRKGDAEAV